MKKAGVTTVHEAYFFVCMRCGHSWEQAYEIEHHTNAEGLPFLIYYTDGTRVPSPFSRLTCANCESNVVRILRFERGDGAAEAGRRKGPREAGGRQAPDPDGGASEAAG